MKKNAVTMLEKWLDSSNNPCYHDLIKALEEYRLCNASEIVKEQAANQTAKRELLAALNMFCCCYCSYC